MSLSQITVAASALEKQRLGYQAISLTNFDNDSEPQIAAGSVVEIGGALFEAAANENITRWSEVSNNTDAWIKLVVSGSTATAEFTHIAPTWSTSKQGWYSGPQRRIGGLYKDGSGNYTIKWLYPAPNDLVNQEMIREGQTRPLLEKVLEIGDWNMDADSSKAVAHGLTHSKIISIKVIIRDDSDSNRSDLVGTQDIAGTLHYKGSTSLDATNINLSRVPSTNNGLFDNTNYDSTSYNRGYVSVKYRA